RDGDAGSGEDGCGGGGHRQPVPGGRRVALSQDAAAAGPGDVGGAAGRGRVVSAAIPITLTCADYARVMPLATGAVKPAGIAPTMILGSHGSWPGRAELLRRAVQDPDVQGGEWSMAQYLYR